MTGFLLELRKFDFMKLALQYVSDANGKTQAVQLPLAEWDKVMAKLKKYEEAFKLKTDIKEALEEVAILRQTKGKKQTLKEFLDEL